MSDQLDPMTATPARLKSWLRTNNCMHLVSESPTNAELKRAVVGRKRRLELEGGPELPRGVGEAVSLTRFLEKVKEYELKGYCPKHHVGVKVKCISILHPLTCLRHDDKCRCIVSNGMCLVCKTPTVGVPAFYIDTLVQDLKDKNVEYHMIGYDGVAKSIFGPNVTPTEVKDMDKVLVNDKLESWFESAMYVSMCLVWNEEKGKVRVSPHNLIPLPLEYMPEYAN